MPTRNDFLRELVLLRHDLELAERVRAEAFSGNADAQYVLGLIFAEGRGVDEDPVEAYAWLSLAVLQGDRDAATLRLHRRCAHDPGRVAIGASRPLPGMSWKSAGCRVSDGLTGARTRTAEA
ncbi:MAG: hypothetical protein MZV65_34600 [Chromatiales bacterium]|nr:hypothetical protein [Chromatiales bacterium]